MNKKALIWIDRENIHKKSQIKVKEMGKKYMEKCWPKGASKYQIKNNRSKNELECQVQLTDQGLIPGMGTLTPSTIDTKKRPEILFKWKYLIRIRYIPGLNPDPPKIIRILDLLLQYEAMANESEFSINKFPRSKFRKYNPLISIVLLFNI